MDLLACSNTNQCQCYYTSESPLILGAIWLKCFQLIPGYMSGELCVSSFTFSSHGSIQLPGRTCHRSIQTSYSSSTLMDGGSLSSHSSQYVVRCSPSESHCKGPFHGCLGWMGVQGLQLLHLLLWHLQHVFCTKVLFLSLPGSGRDNLSIYDKGLPKCWKECTSLCSQEDVPNNAISAPKLADFLFHLFRVGLAWCISGIYLSAFLEPHQLHKALNHLTISKLIHLFYLQCPLYVSSLISGMLTTYNLVEELSSTSPFSTLNFLGRQLPF